MNVELIETASTEIAEYSRTEAALADLRSRMANVEYDVLTVKGMAVAKADRAEVRGLRTSLEATRKAIKAPALEHCKVIDREAARITAELLKLETPIDEQIKARELVLEAEKEARELAERQRITDIHTRIAAIREYVTLAAGCRTAARIDDLLGKLSKISLGDFEEFSQEAGAAHLDAMKRVEAMLIDKHHMEQEQEKAKAEQAAAAAALKAERAEFEAQQAAAKAEADKLAAERQQLAVDRMALENAQREAKEAADKAAYMAAISVPNPALARVESASEATNFVADSQSTEVLVLTSEMLSMPMEPTPPSAEALIGVIATHFKVSDELAAEWLDSADFSTYY